MTLSIVIPSRDDTPECIATAQSARATAPEAEIVIVDDASRAPVPSNIGTQVIRMERRIGVGPARTVGALRSGGAYVLFVDSHCRFMPGWYENALKTIVGREKTVHCASCLGLAPGEMDMSAAKGPYFGATFNFYGQDKNKPNRRQVFESVWLPEQPGDDYELPAVMGACYFWPREWFLRLNPLLFLRSYGVDEQTMSLKCWLAGGEIRMMKSVKIGHQFRKIGLQLGEAWHQLYNKLFAIRTILSPPHSTILESKIQKDGLFSVARREIFRDWHLVAVEQDFNRSIFTKEFPWYINKFGISFPEK